MERRLQAEWPLLAAALGIIALFTIAGALPLENLGRDGAPHHRGEQGEGTPINPARPSQIAQNPDLSGDNQKKWVVAEAIRIVVKFFDVHNGSFSALAAIAVAAFTFLLARTTRGQLIATEKAANGALLSAEAAHASATIAAQTIDAYRVAERAWISLQTVDFKKMQTNKGGPVEGAVLMMWWKNSGRTPAIKCQVWATHLWQKVDFDIASAKFGKDTSGPPRAMTVGPGANFFSERAIITVPELVALARRQIRLFMWGRAEYCDIFASEPRRYSEVCVEVFCDTRPDMVLQPEIPLSFSFMATLSERNTVS